MFDTFFVGLINGDTCALIALGVSLIISTSNVINFAHGSLFALGAMTGWYLAAAAGWPLWLATLPARPTVKSLARLRAFDLDTLALLDMVHSVAFFSWANRLMLILGEPFLQPVRKA